MGRNNIRTLSPFEKRWMKVFAAGIAKKDIKQYVTSTGNYIWHVFSWELLPVDSFVIGDEARKAFNAQDKTNARYYEPWPVDGPHEPAYQSPTAAELDDLTECYVVAADESWTYIKTHENGLCGPYFYKPSQNR